MNTSLVYINKDDLKLDLREHEIAHLLTHFVFGLSACHSIIKLALKRDCCFSAL